MLDFLTQGPKNCLKIFEKSKKTYLFRSMFGRLIVGKPFENLETSKENVKHAVIRRPNIILGGLFGPFKGIDRRVRPF